MDVNDEVKQLRLQIEELFEILKKNDEKRDSQYTDMLLTLRKVESKVIDLESKADHIETRSDEELFDKAKKEAIAVGKVSVSYLQMKLNIGKERAEQMLNMLEGKGIIGGGNGSKPREVLVKS